jgi:hypothetical protein
MLQPPREKTFALILNVSRKGVALGYLQLSFPIRMCKNPTKT